MLSPQQPMQIGVCCLTNLVFLLFEHNIRAGKVRLSVNILTKCRLKCPSDGPRAPGTICLSWPLLPYYLAMPRPALSTPGSTNFTYIIICIRYSVNLTCKLLFCSVNATNIACLSILREGSLLCGFLSSSFFPKHDKFLITSRVSGQRMSFTGQTADPLRQCDCDFGL